MIAVRIERNLLECQLKWSAKEGGDGTVARAALSGGGESDGVYYFWCNKSSDREEVER